VRDAYCGKGALKEYNMTEARSDRIRSSAFVISVVVCIMCSIFFVSLSFMSFGSALGGCEIELDEKINPNNSPVASIIRLPNIGPVRAAAIVAYRENLKHNGGTYRAFRDCNDLQKIRGIGPKTAQNISRWLKFE